MRAPGRSTIHIKNVIINGGEIQYSLLAHCHVRVSVLVFKKKLLRLRGKLRWMWALRSSSNSSSSTVAYSYGNTIPTLWDTSKHRFYVRRTPIHGLYLRPKKLRVMRITHSEGAGTLQRISKWMSLILIHPPPARGVTKRGSDWRSKVACSVWYTKLRCHNHIFCTCATSCIMVWCDTRIWLMNNYLHTM